MHSIFRSGKKILLQRGSIKFVINFLSQELGIASANATGSFMERCSDVYTDLGIWNLFEYSKKYTHTFCISIFCIAGINVEF